MTDILSDIHLWLSIAFLTMLFFLIKNTKKIISDTIQSKITNITIEIDQSVNLLNEATTLYNETTADYSSIEERLKEASLRAKHDDDSYYEHYIAKLNSQSKSNKESFNNYLDIQYQIFILEQKKHLLEKANISVIEYIKSNLSEEDHKNLINSSIDNLSHLLSSK